jgi:hypothetical protein
MSPQADFIVSNGTGAAVRSDLNVQFAAIVSNNSGATEPATMYAYQWWADTTTGLLKLRNSANSAWVTIRQLDGEFSTVPVENGSAAAPSIYFKDSGTDTGLFSPGADQVAISTGGTVRLTSSTTAISSALPIDVPLASAATPSLTFTGDLDTGIFSPGADTLAITTAGTNRLHITSAGLVGIGNTGPDAKLHITGGASFTGGEANLAVTSSTTASVPATISSLNSDATLQIFAGGLGSGGSRGGQIDLKGGAAATDAGTILFRTGTGTGGTSQTEKARLDASGRLLVGISSTSSSLPRLIVSGGADGGTTPAILVANTGATPTDGTALGVYDFSAANHSAAARIIARRDGGTWTAGSSQPTRLEFSTTADSASSPTERMRITSGGQTKAFSSSDYTFLAYSVKGANATTDRLFAGIHSATGVNDGTLSFQVWTNGNVQNTNNSYGAISDIKLKENIVDANSQWDDLKALQVRNYNFKDETNYGTHTQIGLVAQEVELVSPGLVSESPDRDEDGNDLGTVTKSVNYSVLYMKAVKALQEAMERIEQLEQRLNDAGIN